MTAQDVPRLCCRKNMEDLEVAHLMALLSAAFESLVVD